MFLSDEVMEHLVPLMTMVMQSEPLKHNLLERFVADPKAVAAQMDEIAKSTDDDKAAIQSILLHLFLAEKRKNQPVTLIHECPNCQFFSKIELTDEITKEK